MSGNQQQQPHAHPTRSTSTGLEGPFESLNISKGREEKVKKTQEALKRHEVPDVFKLFGNIADQCDNFESTRSISGSIRSASETMSSNLDDSTMGSEEPVHEGAVDDFQKLAKSAAFLMSMELWIREQKKVIAEGLSSDGAKEKGFKKFADKTLKTVTGLETDVLKARYQNSIDMGRCKSRLSKHDHNILHSAYLAAISDKMPEPANLQFRRKNEDQTSWRMRLAEAYGQPSSSGRICWDPVMGHWSEKANLKAAHIVPYCVGEDHVAYIFGLHPTQGFDVIWSTRNGLLLHPRIEAVMDKGQLVIVADPSKSEHLRVVLLDDTMTNELISMALPQIGTFGDLNLKVLTWPEDITTRPAKRLLYFMFLMTLFRRRRYNVTGWEHDRAKFPPKIWATPDKWIRKSLLVELAREIGEMPADDEFLTKNGLATFTDNKDFSQAATAEIALRIRAGLECPDTVEDQEEE